MLAARLISCVLTLVGAATLANCDNSLRVEAEARIVPCATSNDALELTNEDPVVYAEVDAFTARDLARYAGELWGRPVRVERGAPPAGAPWLVWLSTAKEATALAPAPERGYHMRRLPGPAPRFVISADTADALRAASYAWLELLGARFFHPRQEVIPRMDGVWVPRALDVSRTPFAEVRSFQVHTLHPVEYNEALVDLGPGALDEGKALVDWVVKTGQNRLKWFLLQKTDRTRQREVIGALIEYAHARGITVGALVQLSGQGSLQGAEELIDLRDPAWPAHLAKRVEEIFNVPWDSLDLTFGEFSSGDPEGLVRQLDLARETIAQRYPDARVNAVNHVGNFPNLYVPFRGRPNQYYYHLTAYADPRIGELVHTLHFYDLYRRGAMYEHDDFAFQREFLIDERALGRRVGYYPESAYWISSDIDVPLYLPAYTYSRWLDIRGLQRDLSARGLTAPTPIDEHCMFSSGHEWGYWMHDYLAAHALWQAAEPFEALPRHVAGAFGTCAPGLGDVLARTVQLENDYLHERHLIAYLWGESATVDLGALGGIDIRRERTSFATVLRMGDAEQRTFERDVLAPLSTFAGELDALEREANAHCKGMGAEMSSARPFCEEMVDGLRVTRVRTEHAVALYQAVLAHARGASPEEALARAEQRRDTAARVIDKRGKAYRFPLERYVDLRPNVTSYASGYLARTHDQCFYLRREAQAAYVIEQGSDPNFGRIPGCNP
jgi:hypothetical protein